MDYEGILKVKPVNISMICIPTPDFDPYDPKLMDEILKYNQKKEEGPPKDFKKPG